MRNLLLLITIGALCFTSCDDNTTQYYRRNSAVVKKSYPMSDFQSIYLSGGASIELTQADSYSVHISSTEQILKNITLDVKDSVLYIQQTGNIFHLFEDEHLVVKVTMPYIKNIESEGSISLKSKNRMTTKDQINIESSGASNINLDLSSPLINITSTGAGSIKLRGACNQLNVDISGASSVNLAKLIARDVTIDASGASSMKVAAINTLNIDLSGAGSVGYYGDPRLVSKNDGLSSIKRLGPITDTTEALPTSNTTPDTSQSISDSSSPNADVQW